MSARHGTTATRHEDSSPAQLGWQAAETIRSLNHRTQPCGLTDPAEAYELLAALATLSYRLPQLLTQLQQWLQSGHDSGRFSVHQDSADTPAALIAAAGHQLTRASHAATCLGEAVDSAQQHLAHLTAGAGS